MEILDKYGLDVQQKKGKNSGYYIVENTTYTAKAHFSEWLQKMKIIHGKGVLRYDRKDVGY